MDYNVLSVVAKGVQSLKCFEAVTAEGKVFLSSMTGLSRTGLVSIVSKKSGKNINTLTLEIWKHCVDGDIRLKSAPSKAIFYIINNELTDEIVEQILSDQSAKKALRVQAFERFTQGIEAGKTAEQLVKEALDI